MTQLGDDRSAPLAAAEGVEARLLDAASALFAERGYAAVGIREVARRAGVTIGALYHYANSKEMLLVSLLRRSYGRLMPVLQQAAPAGLPAAERIRALARAHIEAEVAQRDLWRVSRTELNLLTPGSRDEIVALRDRFESIWDRVIDEGVKQGEFRVRDARVARLCVLQMCNGVGTWFREGGRLSLGQVVEEVAESALRVLGAS